MGQGWGIDVDKRTNVIDKVEGVIRTLSASLPADELANGWNDESQRAMLAYFLDLRGRLRRGEIPKDTDLTIVRGLDHWGVLNGRLLREAAEISVELATLVRSSRDNRR